MPTKTKIIITLFLIILLAGGALIFLKKDNYFNKDKVEGLQINYINEGEGIEVIDNTDIIYSLSMSAFKDWAQENWDEIFEEKPSFGELREVEIDNFYTFNNTAIISPLGNYLVFSVNDYAALTDISFIGIVDLNKKELSLINKENIGAVQTMLFSPDESYIAYNLDTARSQGDYLTVDNVIERKKEITISTEDILLLSNDNCEELFPQFGDLYFKSTDELYFTAISCGDERSEWILNIKNKEVNKKIIN